LRKTFTSEKHKTFKYAVHQFSTMTTELVTEQPMTMYQRYRTKALLLVGAAGATLAPYAFAGDLNDSISPILDDMVELFAPLLELIIAAVPLIIAIALIGFIIGILDGILSKLRV
jgi:hypothetical protein